RALKGNVDLIYQYVRNNIEIDWMYGLQKGALGALIDKSGTAFDQADLMVKLLRQSGYTASYVSGTITMSGAQFYQWSGIQDSNAACQLLASGGIPASIDGVTSTACATGSGAAISNITLSHIWVKVNIPGSSCASACLFDPSYKPHALPTSIPLLAATGMTAGQPLTKATTGMDTGTT